MHSAALDADVEVIVCDNASTDGTEAAVAEFQATHTLAVVYVRNADNIGAIRNVLRTLELSSGKWWMFLGDDDDFPRGAVDAVASTLRAAERPAVVYFDPDREAGDRGERTYSLTETAAHLLYELGNAGRFAVRGDWAREVLAAKGADFFGTCWPQTELALLTMRSRGDEPLLSVALKSAVSEDHAANTVYTSYYLAKTAILDLYSVANSLRADLGEPFYEAAVAHVFSPGRFNELFNAFVLYGVYDDEGADRRAAKTALAMATRTSEGHARRLFRLMWFMSALPRRFELTAWWCAMSLRHSPTIASAMTRDWAEGARVRRALRAGGARVYGPQDL